MAAVDRDVVKQNLLIEGLMDAVSLGEVHGSFVGRDAAHGLPSSEIRQLTIGMIRELVSEGLFVLGVPTRLGRFEAWDLPLEAAITKIEDVYVKNFEDRWSWTTIVWLDQTDKGRRVAEELYAADNTDPSGT